MKYFKNFSYIIEFFFASLFIDFLFLLGGFDNFFLIVLSSFVLLELLLLVALRKILFTKVFFSENSLELRYGRKQIQTIKYSEITDISRENIAKDWWIVLTTRNGDRIKITSRKKIKEEVIKHFDQKLTQFLIKNKASPGGVV